MSDCGVACLASIARYHGRWVSIACLRQHAMSDRNGTSLLGLSRAAERIGYTAKAIRTPKVSLPRVPTPAIAHVVLPDGAHHYVVMERADVGRVWLMDPAAGERRTEMRETFDARWTGVLLLLVVHRSITPVDRQSSRVNRLWRLAAPHRAALGQALFGALVYTLLGLATSVYVQQIVDSVLADGRVGLLHVMGAVMIGLTAAQTAIGAVRALIMVRVGQHIDAALILGYYRHLLSLPQRFFDGMRVGELTSRITDAVKIRAFVGEVAVEALANVFIVAGSAAMMFAYDWRLAAWTTAMLPLYAALYAIAATINRRQQHRAMERAASLESQVVESLATVGTIKRLGLERHAERQTEARFVRLFRTLGETARTAIWVSAAGQLLGRLSMIGLLWIGAARALDQRLTAGQLMSCYALLGFLTTPMLALVGFSRMVQEARVAGERLFDILELDPEPRDAPIVLTRADAGDVVFEEVAFRYGGRGVALADVSLTCRRGEVTALVGESGSGKSTIAALIQRMYVPDSGRIRVGRHDIAHLQLDSLRALIGVVSQAIDLFDGTILDNLAPGDASPDVPRIVTLCETVGLRETIERMPQGWHTAVGERGVALSGGERQRMALVRALYREPSILILDEATSALDSTNERLVLDVVHRTASAGATVIMIAHRLSTVRAAHHTVMLEQGRVAEQGEPATLTAAGGAYARLWPQG